MNCFKKGDLVWYIKATNGNFFELRTGTFMRKRILYGDVIVNSSHACLKPDKVICNPLLLFPGRREALQFCLDNEIDVFSVDDIRKEMSKYKKELAEEERLKVNSLYNIINAMKSISEIGKKETYTGGLQIMIYGDMKSGAGRFFYI